MRISDARRDAAQALLRDLLDREVQKLTGHESDYQETATLIADARKMVDPVHLAEWRLHTAQRESAYVLAAEQTAAQVRSAIEAIGQLNFGDARVTLEELIERGLPNDYGGPQTHYPLFESRLSLLRESEAARP